MSMRKIKELSQAIAKKQAEIETLRADADRCRHAAEAGSRAIEQLDQLRVRKAGIQAIAFVDKKEPDTDAIDAEILQLEQSAAATLEQARAARLALVMIEGDPLAAQPAPVKPQVARTFTPPQATVTGLGLQTNLVSHPGLVNRVLETESVEVVSEPEPETPKSKLATALGELAELEEQRRVVACAWLVERREKSIDRYMQMISDLGPVLAEIAAADDCRNRLGVPGNSLGRNLAEVFKQIAGDIIPYSRKIEIPAVPGVSLQPRYVTPIDWFKYGWDGKAERASLIGELASAGVRV
jgi:hypothetical protein